MSKGKLAAQAVHAALMLPSAHPLMSVVVLEVSDKKFYEFKAFGALETFVVKDAGYTEVVPGTETVLSFLEDDPREPSYHEKSIE